MTNTRKELVNQKLTHARVLVADDDPENARLVEEALTQEQHSVRTCTDGEAALHLARSWSPHVVLLDINMPKMTGLECLKKIRTLTGGEYVGVILVTANAELREIVEGLDAGADDYITKPFRIEELRARVRACLRVKSLHDAIRRANRRLEEAATLDDLTGLHNMKFTLKKLAEEFDSTRKLEKPFSCIMFDMDHFKRVNDQHDHYFGSAVLRDVAVVIRPILRTGDIAARYGGDEFFIALPHTPFNEAVEVAERMRKALQAHTFRDDQHSMNVTASFGVSTVSDPKVFASLEPKDLIRAADAALYAAKNGGRNRVESQFLG